MAVNRHKMPYIKAHRARTLLSIGLLTGGLISALAAVMGAKAGAMQVGWCLGATPMTWLSMVGHCPWCYSALALIGASAALWPQPMRAPIKI